MGVPLSELLLLAAMILIGGLVTGVLAGLFGIGGGAVIVPVLYEVFGMLGVAEAVRFQLCVGTSLAIIVPTNVFSFLIHRGRGTPPISPIESGAGSVPRLLPIPRSLAGEGREGGAADMAVVRAWALPAVAGVAVGSAIAAFASGAVLKLAFVLFASVIATKLLLGRDGWRLAEKMPSGAPMLGYGFVVGLGSSLLGISGGSISNMILTLQGMPLLRAVATSAGLGVPITLAGTLGYMLAGLPQQALMPPLSIGFVSLVGFTLMAPVSSFTAPYGARLAHAWSKRRLEVAFGCFLLLICARFLATMVG